MTVLSDDEVAVLGAALRESRDYLSDDRALTLDQHGLPVDARADQVDPLIRDTVADIDDRIRSIDIALAILSPDPVA